MIFPSTFSFIYIPHSIISFTIIIMHFAFSNSFIILPFTIIFIAIYIAHNTLSIL